MNIAEVIDGMARDPLRCKVGVWLDTLDESERDMISAAVAVPGQTTRLWRALRAGGLCGVGERTWRTHWSGSCCCE